MIFLGSLLATVYIAQFRAGYNTLRWIVAPAATSKAVQTSGGPASDSSTGALPIVPNPCLAVSIADASCYVYSARIFCRYLNTIAKAFNTSKQPIAPTKDNRLFFFDNVRYIVIIWVTIFHVASGLSGNQESIRDSNSSLSFFIFGAYSVTVMMAIMFFAAGYSSTTSLRNCSTGAFLHNKLLRLDLPRPLGILFRGPTMPYMAHNSRSFAGLQNASYWDFWQR